jgi:DNA-binding response OmpR family regulator
MLTAFPLPGFDWQGEEADEMLVKPMNTPDLVRQLEALLISHEDKKQPKDVLPVGKVPVKPRAGAATA